MATGDRRVAKLTQKVARACFMVRIAGGEMAGHGKGRNVANGVADRRPDGGFVKAGLR